MITVRERQKIKRRLAKGSGAYMAPIATLAGVSKMTLWRYFEGQECKSEEKILIGIKKFAEIKAAERAERKAQAKQLIGIIN